MDSLDRTHSNYSLNDSLTHLLREELLATLSFWDPMELDQIYLELNQTFVIQNPQITADNLIQELKKLEKDKKVTLIKIDQKYLWKKVFPKRTSRLQKILKRFLYNK